MPVKVITPPAVEPLTLAEAKHHLRIDHQEGATWVTAASYLVGDVVKGTDNNDYICTVAHTSGSSTRPITGASYLSYWEAYGADDTYISNLIKVTREYAEWTLLQRAIITQTLQYTTDKFNDIIRLPMPTLQSITSFTYEDYQGKTTTLINGTDFLVDTNDEPAIIIPAYGKQWPTVTLWPVSPITITYVAGYGDATTNVPEEIRHWMRLMVAHYYENREAILPMGHNVMRIPYGIDWLVQGLRVFGRADD